MKLLHDIAKEKHGSHGPLTALSPLRHCRNEYFLESTDQRILLEPYIPVKSCIAADTQIQGR
jgi:hypothetical protein